jgi:hypothetical protein
MDLAQTLVRSVLRAFYETRHILVIDALVIHQWYAQQLLSYENITDPAACAMMNSHTLSV